MNSSSVCLALFVGLLSILGVKCACYSFPGGPCIHDNRAFQPGETWSNGLCQECTCHIHSELEPRGYHCCDSFSIPVYDDTKCEAVFDEESCSFKLSSVVEEAGTQSPDDSSSETSWSSWMLPSWLHYEQDEPDCGNWTIGVGK